MKNQIEEKDLHLSSGKGLSLYITISAAKGLQEIIKTNLGPKGSLKILVNSSGDIKITKEGSILLREMQIQNPIASLIAKTIFSQKSYIGDGTTTKILLLGEVLKKMEIFLENGIHPQILCEGIDLGRRELERWLPSEGYQINIDKKALLNVAYSVVSTKINIKIAEKMSKILVEAILTIFQKGYQLDLNMIEIMQIENHNEMDSRWVKGIVLDHGARHPDMPKLVNNAFILLCNASLEYEKTDLNSRFVICSTFQNENLFTKERRLIDKKIHKIIQLKRFVCKDKNRNFVIINQKGIDSSALDLLAKEGILGIRRAKRRNMERISVLCNCIPINSFDDLSTDCLGFAGLIYEQEIGEEKYTFIENVTNPFSGTILIKGKNSILRKQIEDSIKNTLKTLKECIENQGILKGSGEIELQASEHLIKYSKKLKGKKKFGVEGLGLALLIIPKTLIHNSGNFDSKNSFGLLNKRNSSDSYVKKFKNNSIFDCFSVKKKIYDSVCLLSCQLLLIDDIIMGKGM
jgi:T-complex protein 1 subunit zeta